MSDELLKYNYKVVEAKGPDDDFIVWSFSYQFAHKHDNQTLFNVLGRQKVVPIPGNILIGRFKSSLILFEFVEITQCFDNYFTASLRIKERVELGSGKGRNIKKIK